VKLAYLRPLYERPGPFASVYLATERHTADAAKALSLRWRHARIELVRLGADDATLDAIEQIVTDRGNAAPGRALFAADGQVVHSEVLPEPPPQVSVRVSELPDVMPLLESREVPVPHVCVKADRQGAEIISVGDKRQVTTVDGIEWPIRKVRAGGWSESHYQRNAEETWEANAREVASQVAREAEAVDAEVILVGGDVRARELVLENLSEPYAGRAVATEHGVRSAGAEREAWEEEVNTILHERVDEHQDSVVARFREAYGRGDAVAGLADVTQALRGGQVDALLIARPLRGELWYGPQPHELATSKRTLRELGVDEPHYETAGSVLARAATATDAEIIFTEDVEPPGRVGAVLRYTAA
jgi:Bacterial archaeo-eukaryotic release factor family 2